MKKLFIKNRKNQKLAVVVEETDNQKGLAFIAHGLSGFKEQKQVRTFAEAFLSQNFTVVTFDTTNTFGESDGEYENATITNYYEDLVDVIEWAKGESWYEEPFFLAGHSLGGATTALYSENFQDRVKAVAPISAVISGKLSIENRPKKVEEWDRTGWRIEKSKSIPGLIKKLNWPNYKKDYTKHDLTKKADNLTMPVLMMAGDIDTNTPIKNQRILFDLIPGKKEIHVIKDARHTFVEQVHLDEIKEIMSNWIKRVNA